MNTKKSTTNSLFTPALAILTFAVVFSLIMYSPQIVKWGTSRTTTQNQQEQAKWKLVSNTYQTDWEYTTPSSKDKIGFTLTLKGDVIQDVQVQVYTKTKESITYQTNFGKALPKLVVGKKLSEIASLDTVTGASGTTNNFKQAVASLSQQLSY